MKFTLRKLSPIVALVGLFASAGGFTQTQTVPPTPRRCLMWKAVNGNNVVYLLGSIHIGSKDMYPLPKMVNDAYERSKVLVVEVNINNMKLADAQSFLMANGMYTSGDNLWDHISKATADKVKKFCAKYDTPDSMIAMFKPWVAAVELTVLPMQKAGMDPNLGIDKHFLDLASSNKTPKRIEELETADFQLKLLSGLPENLSDEFLSWTLGESTRTVQDDTKIEKMWLQGDAKELDKEISPCPIDLLKFERSMREDRNPHMADVAEKYLKGGGPCFFVVGAAHLIGSEGVVAILQKRGYKVTQISAADSKVSTTYRPIPGAR